MLNIVKSQTAPITAFKFRLVYKMMLAAGFIIVMVIAALNYFFLDELAESRISQVTEMANTTSVIVSELALDGFYSRDQTRVANALVQAINERSATDDGFLQISIILYPSGVYYASTNPDFKNKKVGLSLLKKLETNTEKTTVVEKLNYELENRTIPVLQFLRNITIEKNGEEKRIAVTQILFNYGKILSQVRMTLLLIGCVLLLVSFVFIWVMYIPVSSSHQKLIKAFDQISQKKFDISLKPGNHGEIGAMFIAFNRMVTHLQHYFQEKQKSKIDSAFNSMSDGSSLPVETALRKTKITCLCARIPGIQAQIEANSPEAVAELISNFLNPFEKIVQEFGGQVIKILGDKIYVLFEGINSIDNSVRTSLKINEKWQLINHENKVINREQQNFGIGLHAAEGIAGTLGRASLSYTFVGKAATVAEYLCSCAQKEEILISSSMMNQTSGAYQHQIVDTLKPMEFAEEDEVLVLTNMPIGQDYLAGTGLSHRTSLAEDAGRPRLKSDLSPTAYGTEMTGIERPSYESSIPDMLEETLTAAPLDSVVSEDLGKNGDRNKESQKKQDIDDTRKPSLWDDVDAEKTE